MAAHQYIDYVITHMQTLYCICSAHMQHMQIYNY